MSVLKTRMSVLKTRMSVLNTRGALDLGEDKRRDHAQRDLEDTDPDRDSQNLLHQLDHLISQSERECKPVRLGV